MGMQPGIYTSDRLSIDDYHSCEGLSASGIKLLLDCPKKYWHEYLNPSKYSDAEEEKKEGRAKIIGQAVHTLALEPELFDQKFYILPNIDRRTKNGKETFKVLQEENKFKTLLSISESKQINAIIDSIKSNKAFDLLTNSKKNWKKNIETSIFFKQNDILLKSRPDFFNEFVVLDLKTTKLASKNSFIKDIYNYKYYIQAAMALDAINTVTNNSYTQFLFLAVEKEPPYLTALYVLDEISIEKGREEYKKAITIYQESLIKEEWCGYPELVTPISLPTWAFTMNC